MYLTNIITRTDIMINKVVFHQRVVEWVRIDVFVWLVFVFFLIVPQVAFFDSAVISQWWVFGRMGTESS